MSVEGQPFRGERSEFKSLEVTEQQILEILHQDGRLISYLASRKGVNKADHDDIKNEIALRIIEEFRNPMRNTDWNKFVSSNPAFRISVYKLKIIDYERSRAGRGGGKREFLSDELEAVRSDDNNIAQVENKLDLNKILDSLGSLIKKEKKRRVFMHIIKSFLNGKNLEWTKDSLQREMGIEVTFQRISQIFIECAERIRKEIPGFPANLKDLRTLINPEDDDEQQNEKEAKKDQFMVPMIIKKREEIEKKLGDVTLNEAEKIRLKRQLLIIDYYVLTNDPKKIEEADPILNKLRLSELRKKLSHEIFGDDEYIHRNRNIIREAYSLRTHGNKDK